MGFGSPRGRVGGGGRGTRGDGGAGRSDRSGAVAVALTARSPRFTAPRGALARPRAGAAKASNHQTSSTLRARAPTASKASEAPALLQGANSGRLVSSSLHTAASSSLLLLRRLPTKSRRPSMPPGIPAREGARSGRPHQCKCRASDGARVCVNAILREVRELLLSLSPGPSVASMRDSGRFWRPVEIGYAHIDSQGTVPRMAPRLRTRSSQSGYRRCLMRTVWGVLVEA